MQFARYSSLLCIACLGALLPQACSQGQSWPHRSEVTARLTLPSAKPAHKAENTIPAVMWLQPLHRAGVQLVAPGMFTLLQKDKMFHPHLLVVPVGSTVSFPNADPFFHNVFSLFDGRRFDLGLYEAGSTRSVVFSREGVSYIFCDIHSEMSAVVVALSTPYFAVADSQGTFRLGSVPEGDYVLHLWIEGQKQAELDRQARPVHIAAAGADLGVIGAVHAEPEQHLDKFGHPYEPEPHPIY